MTTPEQTLSDNLRNYRMNIRNAYLTASVAELDKEIEYRTRIKDPNAVKFLNELREETITERFSNRGKELAALAAKSIGE